MADTKQQLGQFFTKNSDYILKGLNKYVRDKNIIDPFAGNGDLIKWAKKNKVKNIKGYDIDDKYINNKNVFLNDSVNNQLKYDFVLTNPPYLNVNKADQDTKEKYFKNFDFEDLYQISLFSILNSNEGIVIVPINFLSAENSKKIRNIFFSKFKIIEMNYFKQQVFPDTTYNVIAFYYKRKNYFENQFLIKTYVYPDNKIVRIRLKKDFDWTIGGEFSKEIRDRANLLGIYRLTEKDISGQTGLIEINASYNHVKTRLKIKVSEDVYKIIKSNIILLKAIDSGSDIGKIALEDIRKYGTDCLISKLSSRHMIYLVFKKQISVAEQKKIIELFNKEINKLREFYLSLFLTNYRDNDRKRISFDFTYKFINYLYYNKLNYDKTQSVLF
ncbi:MAG: hypothetical protein A2909_02925 [Candidatus Tagabacteria bacterium RIFCSPLOWO2_01_FULL_39_11]|uniref:Type II methyltransferase M.TaqI-like domain-containing protein n=1 Tax=Candidatus Tagabacteria bacterium RIFCSPLOWO2_01_FULL_39_11 TaxID=1802295 RepID=A0A1G2LRL9_9BACT|nr:MAG: hypothetical protein A2909_02925 [Candidatus Tagabacteria bacterium RIFCSPLOWO2_01_FULL_39_11]